MRKLLIQSHRVVSGGNQDLSPTFIYCLSLLGLLKQRYQKLGGSEITFIYHRFRGRESKIKAPANPVSGEDLQIRIVSLHLTRQLQ